MSDTPPDPTVTFTPLPATEPGRAPAAPPTPAGRYELIAELGRGGMGAVLRARDRSLNRDLAVKVLLDRHQNDLALRRRFVEEAQVGGQLQHPGVVPVYELGELADGRPFFAMKLIKGRTLAELLAERPDPAHDLPRLLQIFEQVCQTVAYAHSKRVVHRDLKPSNVMVGAFGEVQVMDWGLAKVLDESGHPVPEAPAPTSVIETVRTASPDARSHAGSVLGTYAYMPPEQSAGLLDRLDRRCDVFGLGAILCEVLTGQPPYVGPTAEAVKLQAMMGDLTGAAGRLDRSGADAELVALAKACLAAAPDGRPADAAAVAEAVTAYRVGVEGRLRRAELERAAAQARAEGERKRRRLTAALALASVVTLLLLGGGAWWGWRDRAERAAEADAAVREADGLWQRASLLEHDPVQRAATLTTAHAVAARARSRLGWGVGDAALAERAERLYATLSGGLHEAQVLADLEEARLQQAELEGPRFDRRRALPHYATAFQHLNLDPTTAEPDAVAQALRERPEAVRVGLLAALDDWADLTPDAAARERLRKAARLAEPPESFPARLRAALDRSDRAAVRDLVRSAGAKELPPAAAVALAERLERAKAAAEAVELLQAAYRAHPNDFWLNHTLACLLRDAQPPQPDRAVRHFSAALALRPKNPVVYTNLGFALSRAGRPGEAVEAFRTAVDLNRDCYRAHIGLGDILLDQKMYGPAGEAYRKALARYPDETDASLRLGIALRQSGQPEQAVEVYRQALVFAPDEPAVLTNLGNALAALKRYAEAAEAFRKVLARKPGHPRIRGNLVGALADQGKYPEAVAELRQWRDRLPADDPGRPDVEAALRSFERTAAADAKLPAVLRGEALPANAAEQLELARLCQRPYKGLNAASARFFADAFAADPKRADNPRSPDRYNAACSAALAAAGQGADAANLPAKARVSLRRQALAWLTADLAARRRVLESGPPADRTAQRNHLRYSQTDPDLAGVRDPAALAALPEAERAGWAKLWADLAALLAKPAGPG
jgi:serine/threonine-protein kinase